jgi:hypothetical protein
LIFSPSSDDRARARANCSPRIQSRSEPSPAHAINNDDAPVFGVPRCRKTKETKRKKSDAKIASRCSRRNRCCCLRDGPGNEKLLQAKRRLKTAVFGPSTRSLSLWLTLGLFIMFRAAFGACFTCALAQSEHRRRASQSVRVIVGAIVSLDGREKFRLVDIKTEDGDEDFVLLVCHRAESSCIIIRNGLVTGRESNELTKCRPANLNEDREATFSLDFSDSHVQGGKTSRSDMCSQQGII